MNLKRALILLSLPMLCSFQPNTVQSKIISIDAKHTCKCLKFVDKEIKRLDKKVEQREKLNYNHKGENKPLFGGNSLEFDLEGCRNGKRNRKIKEYINALDEIERSNFDRKVLKAVKRKCPDVYKRIES